MELEAEVAKLKEQNEELQKKQVISNENSYFISLVTSILLVEYFSIGNTRIWMFPNNVPEHAG